MPPQRPRLLESAGEVDEKEEGELEIAHEVKKYLVDRDAEETVFVPTPPDVGPECLQIAASVYAVGNCEGTPLGPEKLYFRGHVDRRKMFLRAQVRGLKIGELQLIILLAQL